MTTYHREHFLDRATMFTLRAMIAVQPKLEFAPETRPMFDQLMTKTEAAEGVTYEAAIIGGIAGWWCKPQRAMDGAAVIYFHGGAYVLGSAAAYRNFVGNIAAKVKAPFFVVDYALAPEHPFPSAIRDAEDAYRGLSALGFSRLAIAGDSAGGGLALALLLSVMAQPIDNLANRPVAAAVMSPWTDLALTGDSVDTRAKADPLLSRSALEHAAEIYLGHHDYRDPKASPVFGRFADLPPVLLHVGEDEILLDDSRRVAEQIDADGGRSELHIWQGMTHVFPSNLTLKSAVEALDILGAFLEEHLQSQHI